MFGFSKHAPQAQSRDIARERLKTVLSQDRSKVSPRMVELLRADVIRSLSSYMELDESACVLTVQASGSSGSMLVASFPVKKVKEIGRNAF